jgi:hypothetical protein
MNMSETGETLRQGPCCSWYYVLDGFDFRIIGLDLIKAGPGRIWAIKAAGSEVAIDRPSLCQCLGIGTRKYSKSMLGI